jgi:Ca2+-binding RTX toxin-like protein
MHSHVSKTLRPRFGHHTLFGDSASVDAAGLSGDDYLSGGAGDDELFGGKGRSSSGSRTLTNSTLQWRHAV